MALVLLLSFVAGGVTRAESVKGLLICAVLLVAQHWAEQLFFLVATVTAPIAFGVHE